MFAGSTGNIANSVLMLHGVVLKFSRIRERCFCFWFRFWPLKDRRCEDSPSWNTWPLGPGRIRKSGQPHSIAILDAEVTVFACICHVSIFLNLSNHLSSHFSFFSLRKSKWVLNVCSLAPNHRCLNPHRGSFFKGAQARSTFCSLGEPSAVFFVTPQFLLKEAYT